MMNKTKLARFAWWVSFVSSPFFWVSAGVFRLLWSAIQRREISFHQAELLLLVILGGPILFFLGRVYKGTYDFDLSQRQKRLNFYLLSLGFGFVGLNILYVSSQDLFRYFLSLMLVGFVMMVITFWEKISLHVGALTAFYIAYNLTHHWRAFFFLPVIGLVGWSRVYLRHHTLRQVLEGFLVPIVVLPAAFYVFGVGF